MRNYICRRREMRNLIYQHQFRGRMVMVYRFIFIRMGVNNDGIINRMAVGEESYPSHITSKENEKCPL